MEAWIHEYCPSLTFTDMNTHPFVHFCFELDGVFATYSQFAKTFGHFPERDRAILAGRTLKPNVTLAHLGQRFNVTRERIRQIEKRWRQKMTAYRGEGPG